MGAGIGKGMATCMSATIFIIVKMMSLSSRNCSLYVRDGMSDMSQSGCGLRRSEIMMRTGYQ